MGGVLICWEMTVTASGPTKGGRPVRSSYRRAPSEYRSARALDLLAQGLLGGHVRHRADHHPLLGEAGAAGGDGGCGQAEVPETGGAPSVSQTLAGLMSRWTMPRAWACSSAWAISSAMRTASATGSRWSSAPCEEVVDRSAGHVLAHDVGPAVIVADVEDGDDVGVVAEAAHGLGFPADALEAGGVEILGLDGGQGHLPVEGLVVCQVDALAPPFTEKSADLVPPGTEGGRRWRGWDAPRDGAGSGRPRFRPGHRRRGFGGTALGQKPGRRPAPGHRTGRSELRREREHDNRGRGPRAGARSRGRSEPLPVPVSPHEEHSTWAVGFGHGVLETEGIERLSLTGSATLPAKLHGQAEPM